MTDETPTVATVTTTTELEPVVIRSTWQDWGDRLTSRKFLLTLGVVIAAIWNAAVLHTISPNDAFDIIWKTVSAYAIGEGIADGFGGRG